MNTARKTIRDYANQFLDMLRHREIFEHDAVISFLDRVAFDIFRFGPSGQIDELLEIIPTLPVSAQSELQKFVCGSDDRIFCKSVLCDPGPDSPDDWRHPPTQQRAEVDYSANPISIVIHCSDGTFFSIPPDDAYRTVVFAVRNLFAPRLNEERNAE